EVVYDPTMLTLTGMTTAVSGWSVTTFDPSFTTLSDGRKVARFTVGGSSALGGTAPVVVGSLQASVPGTTLSGALSGSGTSLTVASAATFAPSGQYVVRIDSEEMLVTAGQGGTTWTVTRGVNGTTAASHAAGATVMLAGGLYGNKEYLRVQDASVFDA